MGERAAGEEDFVSEENWMSEKIDGAGPLEGVRCLDTWAGTLLRSNSVWGFRRRHRFVGLSLVGILLSKSLFSQPLDYNIP